MDAAFFSFFGIVIGASLQYVFTRHLDNQKHHRDLKTKAYADYLKCVCELANLGKISLSAEGRELLAKTADAKSRICLYGTASAIEAFAEFERRGATMGTPEQRDAFIKMVAIMRRDSARSSEAAHDDLAAVLLGAARMTK